MPVIVYQVFCVAFLTGDFALVFGVTGSEITSSESISIVWWQREAKDLLPEGFTHPGSPNGIFTKETDIMDVWFDSDH